MKVYGGKQQQQHIFCVPSSACYVIRALLPPFVIPLKIQRHFYKQIKRWRQYFQNLERVHVKKQNTWRWIRTKNTINLEKETREWVFFSLWEFWNWFSFLAERNSRVLFEGYIEKLGVRKNFALTPNCWKRRNEDHPVYILTH